MSNGSLTGLDTGWLVRSDLNRRTVGPTVGPPLYQTELLTVSQNASLSFHACNSVSFHAAENRERW